MSENNAGAINPTTGTSGMSLSALSLEEPLAPATRVPLLNRALE